MSLASPASVPLFLLGSLGGAALLLVAALLVLRRRRKARGVKLRSARRADIYQALERLRSDAPPAEPTDRDNVARAVPTRPLDRPTTRDPLHGAGSVRSPRNPVS